MRPIRLELRNFLAYRAPETLNLKGIDLACLSGANGAGKSSLLDGITWALWGSARATRSDDELIHMGQEEMYVILDFQQDQVIYRVVRKRSKKGRGQSSLLMFKQDDKTQEFQALTGESSIRETQALITQILKLDYETFINSAFIQQGKADAFTIKTPRERKQILSDILGLSRWTVYEEQVKQSLKAINTELGIIDSRVAEIEQEETRESALRGELELAGRQVEDARQKREAAEERLAEVSGAPAAMQAAQTQLGAIERRIREHERDLASLAAELEQQQKRLDHYKQVIETREQIEEGYARLEQARQINDDLGDKLVQRADADSSLHDLERQLDAARAELEAQASVHRDRIREAEQALAQVHTIEKEWADVQIELDSLEKRMAERETIRDDKSAIAEEAATLRTRNEALRLEMNDIKSRMTMIQAAGEAICPVCRQPLDEPHRAELVEQYRADGKTRGDTFRTNDSRLKAITETTAAYEDTLRVIEIDLRRYDPLKAREGALHEKSMALAEASQRAAVEQAALDDIRQMLGEENFSLELRNQIEAVRAEIDALGYDKEMHSEARETLSTFRAFETQKRELEMAIVALPDVETNIQNLQTRHERTAEQHTEASADSSTLRAEITALKDRVDEEQKRRLEVSQMRTLERSATEKLISVEQQIRAIDAARKRKLELQQRREGLCEDESIYQQLKDAFGQNGIPAMIIEAAIPELEDATNKLLARMTDGRMNIRFDTQREKKTGGVLETLDILISDELGTRSYDMFSGGERFRVNFALRIALSQFLAHRAGARLQTLVIDEGFGSQDDQGRERLVEAISVIKSDFDLILIVTHIDELRDQFPIHIEVRKTPNGSTVEIK